MSLSGSFLKPKSKRKRPNPIAYLSTILEGDLPFDPWSLSIAEFDTIIESFQEIFKSCFFNPNYPHSLEQVIHISWLYLTFSLYCHYYECLNDFPFDKFQKVLNLDKKGSHFLGNVIGGLNNLSMTQFKARSFYQQAYRPYQQLLQINAVLVFYWRIISKNMPDSIAYALFPLQLNEDKLAACRTFANVRHGKKIPVDQINHLKINIINFLEENFSVYPSGFRPRKFFPDRFCLNRINGMARDFPLSISDWSIVINGNSHYLPLTHRFTIKRVWKEIVFESGVHIFMDCYSWAYSATLIVRTLQFPHVYAFAIEMEKLLKLQAFIRNKMAHAQKMFEQDVNIFCYEHDKSFSEIMFSSDGMEYFKDNPYLLAFHELSRLDKEIQIWVDKKYLQMLMDPIALRTHPFFIDLSAEIANERVLQQIWKENAPLATDQSLQQKTREYQASRLSMKWKQSEFLERVLPILSIKNCIRTCYEDLLTMAQSYPEFCDLEYLNVASLPLSESLFESKMVSAESFTFSEPEEPLEPDLVQEWQPSFTPQKKMSDLSRLPHHLHLQPTVPPIKQICELMQRMEVSSLQAQAIENFLSKKKGIRYSPDPS